MILWNLHVSVKAGITMKQKKEKRKKNDLSPFTIFST